MKSKNTEATQRVLVLLKIDANNLFKRIKERKSEYLEIFALRRTREHFPMIFKNRYEGTSIMDLSHCSTDLITTLDQFYTLVEEMNWYLYQTEDMPNTVEDFIDRKIRRMEKLLSTLNLFLDAELGIESEQASQEPEVRFIDQEPDFSDSFNDDTSQET
ncbi:hypothetical protein [Peredibacter starrii]|uniref:Uncharacterized protein n=1 Tax=Peredibacter starrii TaxID=28202 RepID=A0AAX4HRG3_9BACT|nr:hypothetical protein [Peredibacter starrii]WPU65765.1 hypothetical protein SOO65_03300 [Peredibacter starrii]